MEDKCNLKKKTLKCNNANEVNEQCNGFAIVKCKQLYSIIA